MPTPLTNEARPPAVRRWLQFSLRGLLALSLTLGWIAMKRQRELRAVRAINKDGGHVVYEYYPDDGRNWRSAPILQTWLSGLGEGIIWDAYQVSFYPTNATDQTLSHLQEFSEIKVLALGETEVSDAGLVHLRRLANLALLDLNHTQITDQGLPSLTELEQLQILQLVGTRVTEEGVAKLQRALPTCRIMYGPTYAAATTFNPQAP
jgi:hypothetical protein